MAGPIDWRLPRPGWPILTPVPSPLQHTIRHFQDILSNYSSTLHRHLYPKHKHQQPNKTEDSGVRKWKHPLGQASSAPITAMLLLAVIFPYKSASGGTRRMLLLPDCTALKRRLYHFSICWARSPQLPIGPSADGPSPFLSRSVVSTLPPSTLHSQLPHSWLSSPFKIPYTIFSTLSLNLCQSL